MFLFRLYLWRKMALRVSYLLSLTLSVYGKREGGRGEEEEGRLSRAKPIRGFLSLRPPPLPRSLHKIVCGSFHPAADYPKHPLREKRRPPPPQWAPLFPPRPHFPSSLLPTVPMPTTSPLPPSFPYKPPFPPRGGTARVVSSASRNIANSPKFSPFRRRRRGRGWKAEEGAVGERHLVLMENCYGGIGKTL